MPIIPFISRMRFGRQGVHHRAAGAPSRCFACSGLLSVGPARGRGFCAECWERSRLSVVDEELGGEA